MRAKVVALLRHYPVQQAAGFQLLWLAAVIGRNSWLWLPVLLICCHLYTHRQQWRAELSILPVALLGLVVDGGLTLVGIYQFNHLPVWLLALWAGFVLTLNVSMVWLRNLPNTLLAVIGAVSGTGSYLAGERLGAVVIATPTVNSVVIIAGCWALLLPLLVRAEQRWRHVPPIETWESEF